MPDFVYKLKKKKFLIFIKKSASIKIILFKNLSMFYNNKLDVFEIIDLIKKKSRNKKQNEKAFKDLKSYF